MRNKVFDMGNLGIHLFCIAIELRMHSNNGRDSLDNLTA